jgi:hypothetical protein
LVNIGLITPWIIILTSLLCNNCLVYINSINWLKEKKKVGLSCILVTTPTCTGYCIWRVTHPWYMVEQWLWIVPISGVSWGTDWRLGPRGNRGRTFDY